jgi:hypothetical protein
LGIARAPFKSSKVSVIPIPSIVKVIPNIVNFGVTQTKLLGFTSPIKHPNATHIGNKVDTPSPTTSTQFLTLLSSLSPFVLKVFDEMPQKRVCGKWGVFGLWSKDGSEMRDGFCLKRVLVGFRSVWEWGLKRGLKVGDGLCLGNGVGMGFDRSEEDCIVFGLRMKWWLLFRWRCVSALKMVET